MMCRCLLAHRHLQADDNVWVGIVTANSEGQKSPVFCAGADLKAIETGRGSDLSTQRGGFGGFVYRQRKKPIIIAVWVFREREERRDGDRLDVTMG